MRRFLVVAVASLLAQFAFAEDRPPNALSLHCVPPSPLRDGPVSSQVSYSVAGGWSIAHTFADRRVVRREQQYEIRDGGHLAWEGAQKKNSSLVMTGKVVNAGGRHKYVERLQDRGKGGKKLSEMSETCTVLAGDAALAAHPGVLATKPAGADQNAAATPSSPAPAPEAPAPDKGFMPNIAIVAPLALGFVAIAPILVVRLNACRRRQKVLKLVDAAVAQHRRALIRKRFQTLRHDDYGNIIADHWLKELNYFLEKVVEPAVTGLGEKAAAIYRDMRPEILASIEGVIEAQENSSETFTLGPNLTPTDYEKFCAQQLRAAGWVANTTKASGDQGTDILAQKGGVRLVVQCKLFSQPVGNKAVQEVAAARAHEQADCAAVVSNAKYTFSAQQLAATNQVLLLHHSDLMHIDELIAT